MDILPICLVLIIHFKPQPHMDISLTTSNNFSNPTIIHILSTTIPTLYQQAKQDDYSSFLILESNTWIIDLVALSDAIITLILSQACITVE